MHINNFVCLCIRVPCKDTYTGIEEQKKLTKFMRRRDLFSDYICCCCSTENRIMTILRDFVALQLTGDTLHAGLVNAINTLKSTCIKYIRLGMEYNVDFVHFTTLHTKSTLHAENKHFFSFIYTCVLCFFFSASSRENIRSLGNKI